MGVLLFLGLSSCSSAIKIDDIQLPQSSPTPVSQVSNTPNPYAALEQSVYQQINQYRRTRNLPPLTLDSRMSNEARLHSQAMASGRVPFSHEGFQQRGDRLNQVIPYRSVAENVAYNQGYSDPGEQAVQGWIKSTGHRENIEGQYNLTGVGIAKNAKGEYYFTQIFIQRR